MKPLTGGLVGALVTGLAVVAWHARPVTDTAWAAGQSAPSAVHLVSDTVMPMVGAQAGLQPAAQPFSVACEPGQRAVMRQAPAWNGTMTTEAACVGASTGFEPDAGVIAPRSFAPTVRPVSYTVADRVAPERIVYRDQPVRRTVRSERSWQKRALVIGGSAGAGAGIGAIAGGKKGALIGAAIGGGAGTIYEFMRK